MAALAPWLAGCSVASGGMGTTATTGSTAGPVQTGSSSNPQPKIAEITNLGASITCGYYATQQGASGYIYSQLGYAGLFDAYLGAPAQNLCRAGDQAADTVRTWVMPHTAPAIGATQLYTIMVGTNDAAGCMPTETCLANWRGAMTATITWLALPAADKVLGNSLKSASADWTPDLNVGVATSTPGASLSFPVTQAVAGRSLYIAYRVFDAGTVNGGNATVKLDGTPVKVLNTIVDTGHPISTANGLKDTIFVAAIPLGAAGSHTVTLTTGSSGGFFSFQWAGVSSASYLTVPGAPRVMAATLPASTTDSLTAILKVYNSALTDLVSALDADGMYVTLVPCESILDLPSDYYDFIHPNDSGHQKIALAFKNKL